ncbi:Serine/threonine protein phosphatase 2A [Spraguea lophii 42_110]|uniref:Serine/threonine protein phosphatase 2A n=1 Tax=Spraguea lophii (strain 42_110) TaxID=1358809 RepID=S7W933_SPRLO|nr:Serine/threonine protein phosphatase 2A [Spraguea lophii 42_110]
MTFFSVLGKLLTVMFFFESKGMQNKENKKDENVDNVFELSLKENMMINNISDELIKRNNLARTLKAKRRRSDISYTTMPNETLYGQNDSDDLDINITKRRRRSLYNLPTNFGLMNRTNEINEKHNNGNKKIEMKDLKSSINNHFNDNIFNENSNKGMNVVGQKISSLLLSFKHQETNYDMTPDDIYLMSKLQESENTGSLTNIEECILDSNISSNTIKAIIDYLKRMIKFPIKFGKEENEFRYYNQINNSNDYSSLIQSLNILNRTIDYHGKNITNINNVITENDISGFFEYTQHENVIVRILIRRIIESLFLKFNEAKENIEIALKNETVKYLERERNYRGIENILQLYSFIISNSQQCKDIFTFKQFILPLLKNTTIFLHQDDCLQLLKKYCSIEKIFAEELIKYLRKTFHHINTPSKVLFLRIVMDLIEECFVEIYPYENEICYFINYSMKNEHHLLIDTISPLFSSPHIISQLSNISKTFIKKVFFNIYRASKKYWYEAERSKILQIITILIFIDKDTFKECVVEYNKTQYKKKIEIKTIEEDMMVDCLGAQLIKNKNKFKNRKGSAIEMQPINNKEKKN